MATTTQVSNSGSGTSIYGGGSNGNKGIDRATRDKILDLGTSDQEVLDLMQTRYGKEDLTPLQQNELQFLFSRRQQNATLLSNLIRAFFDTASNVVRNIRG